MACDFVEARVTTTLGGPLTGDWASLEMESRSHEFRGELRVAAGGWYELEIRLIQNGRSHAREAIPHIGVREELWWRANRMPPTMEKSPEFRHLRNYHRAA
jgi:hypothetical protein